MSHDNIGKHRQDLYLAVILEAADAIADFTKGLKKDDFLNDELRQSAVIQKLIVIGTAVVRLPRGFWKQHREVNWRAISRFRFIGLHQYFSLVDASILWITISKDVPALRDKVAQIVKEAKTG